MSSHKASYLVYASWLAIGLAFGIWLWTYLHFHLKGGMDFHKIGPLGDWVTGLTAPFLSVAGFLMIYAAFRQQASDTQSAREEFSIQRFESTFFQLIQLYHQHVNSIQQSYAQKAKEEFFEAAHRYLKKQISNSQDPEKIQEAYVHFYRKHFNYIDHFVRHILFTLNFVHHNQVFSDLKDADQERERYLGILRAQLSTEELFLLFYHTLCDPTGYTSRYRTLLLDYRFFGRILHSPEISPNIRAIYQEEIESTTPAFQQEPGPS